MQFFKIQEICGRCHGLGKRRNYINDPDYDGKDVYPRPQLLQWKLCEDCGGTGWVDTKQYRVVDITQFMGIVEE